LFKQNLIAAAVTAACSAWALAYAGAIAAQTTGARSTAPTELPTVIVIGNPLGSDLFDLVPPVSFLGGEGLVLRRRSTLGETIGELPGVTSTYFGPNASRPVIRGLDGDRIRIMQNGIGMLDASSVSPDHSVSVDPLIIDRVEVVRGPAALLYGGSAIGGVVNVIDNRIPQTPLKGLSGAVEGRYGGAERERGGAVVIEGGNGRIALHADVYGRETEDLKIPGFMRSDRLRATGSGFGLPASGIEPKGTLTNSSSRSSGGALGVASTWDQGYVGVSFGSFDANYGTVGEETVRVDMNSNKIDIAGEMREIGNVINAVKFKFAHTDYEHQEIDARVIGTTFTNNGHEARLEALHGNIGPFKGAVGVQFTNFDFSALGAEAFVPQTNTDAKGVFVYEEWPLGSFKLTLGARYDRTDVKSDGGGSVDASTGNPRFDAAQERTFSTGGGALGGLYTFTPNLALAANFSYTERAPTYYELFANGPHIATLGYEVGNAGFENEKSNAVDVALRMRSGPHSGSVGLFYQRFNNFITAFNSGNMRGADGELNPVNVDGDGAADGSGEEIFNELAFRAVPAVFRGFEAQGKFRLMENGGNLDLELKADYVRAHNRDTGEPLPRIAPLRFGGALDWRRQQLGARLELTRVQGQDRVSTTSAELPTDGYTMLNVSLSYRPAFKPANLYAFLRGTNLLDVEARNHVSFLKDIAPMGERALQVGLRGTY